MRVSARVCVCVNLKAGTNPPNKHVSSHLWLDPAGNQDSTLQKLIFTGRICCMLGIARAAYYLSVWFPVRGFCCADVKVPPAPRVLSWLLPLPFFTSSILDLHQSAGLRLKVNREVTVKAAQWWQDQRWLKLAPGWEKKKEMHEALSVWLNVCTVQTLTTLVSLCCPLHPPVIYIPSASVSQCI